MNLNSEPKIIGMANALNVDVDRPADAIMEYCRAKVAKFLRRAGRIANVVELQKLICERLNLAVHEIWSDGDIATLASRYLNEGEIAVFAAVTTQLKPDTFGMITQLQRRAETDGPGSLRS